MALGDEALGDGAIEEGLERREVAADVEQADRLGVELELRPRQHLGQLLERAEAARQGDERVGERGHLRPSARGASRRRGARSAPGWASSRSTSPRGITPTTSPPAASAASATAPISPSRPPP